MIILDGKKVASRRKEELTAKISKYHNNGLRKPKLVVIMVGNDPASEVYVSHKIKVANEVGIYSELLRFDKDIKKEELYNKINELNNDQNIDGILLQLPLPIDFIEEDYLQAITPSKDVDGFHYINQGKMLQGYDTVYPCTPLGIINLLEEYNISVKNKDITLIGTSNIVGKPLGMMLLNNQATITMCNKNTKNIKDHTINADIIISATGKQFIITEDMIKKDAVIIDVGIIRDPVTNKLVGDVDFENVKLKSSYITPVPGGVGPMTVITLMENTFMLYEKHINKSK
ncbi:bifunctional 5,10-methylenetetrahydrofolate dehydrogenase/5,10-methenyltetrahydrofolate cyclohydrolase [Mesoplasma florum]|uniref:bifunctional 5,10-methylenetetrahydrofolate dehydrogenase/5,10-methenyltetrahydrofolate cyclohydrolase n=1 Tax=Mesoplasma florum TaxID=2151 RepID=UPI000BE436E2|nr:bifunctional 5,10-methylenetetrahydrofolate dehydrogenase/5,10-methenyltetrahydrofolate cyclohydrolase [Mesoplasma florum]ATI73123.1 bifunctional 5,10-methylene-tetrahydrofolate dehydrogenase/5,10-methylene-tetrahydrofolate cyclohydrolase [Mesoplasma florum]ATI73810.1 bifunctional 5,10-methylene-tetrahydrofolate dehydrogenase/5,10-methylene-tetrahydrofolate cyclohydrolase [Mesoplasma florum]AVN61525.1 bifunctional 5,10-methylene-tetrahydrofolate dehydrogenase/5,10-methylene-tetrahydrofolate c